MKSEIASAFPHLVIHAAVDANAIHTRVAAVQRQTARIGPDY